MSDQETFRDYLVEEFLGDYREQRVSRRDTLKLLAGLMGGIPAATALVAACSPAPPPPPAPTATSTPPAATPRPAATAVGDDRRVAATDPSIRAEQVRFASGADTIMGYFARPSAGSGPFPAILVCHENRGLTDHIADVTRRYAKSGYVALAVDLLSRAGGTAGISDPTTIPGQLNDPDRNVADFQAGLAFLKRQSFVRADRIGMTGFCFGGGVTWLTAARTPELKAVAPYYGPGPADPAVLANVKAVVLGVFASEDQNVNGRIPGIEAALKDGRVSYELKLYPNSRHGFHNDTGANYSAEAARAAWTDTLALFDKHLKG